MKDSKIRRKLYEELIKQAIPFRELIFNKENWIKEFGFKETIQTPLGIVKLGSGQFLKIVEKQRDKYIGLIKPTLKKPFAVIKDDKGAWILVKAFKSEKTVTFYSVTYEIGGERVSITNRPARKKQVLKLIESGEVLYTETTALVSSTQDTPKNLANGGGLNSKSAPNIPESQVKKVTEKSTKDNNSD